MVFIHASRSGFGRIPTDDGYGFNFSSNSEKVDDDEDDGFSLKKRKLMDRTVQVQGSSYTMRFMLGEFEYESAQIIGGQVYNGDGNDEKQVIARLGAALFDIRHPDLQRAGYVMAQGLHCVADAMTQEVYQACTALFTPSGEPKGAFQTLLRSKGQLRKLVYISGVFVDQAHMGKGLGLEFVRNLLRSLQCLRFYCADCQDFKFATWGEIYCNKACAPPGTEFQSMGTSDDDDDDDDDNDSEDEW
eukprot:gene11549-13646_t